MASLADISQDLVLRIRSSTAAFTTKPIVDAMDRVGDASTRMARETRTNLRKMGDGAKQEGGTIGREVGAELASNLGQAIAAGGGTAKQAILETLGGLATAFGPKGYVAAGVLGGAAIMFAALEAQAQATRDQINLIFSKLDPLGHLSDTAARESVLEKIGGGDVAKGFQEVDRLARAAGVGVQVMLDYLAGLPVGAGDVAKLRDQLNETKEIDTGRGLREVPTAAQLAEKEVEKLRQKMLVTVEAAEAIHGAINKIPSRKDVSIVITAKQRNIRLPNVYADGGAA